MASISVTLKTGTTPYRPAQLKKIPLANFGDDINFTIQNSAGSAVNLTGLVPKFALYRPSVRMMQQVFQKDCTIVSGAGGTCKYTVKEGDFITLTQFFARVEIYTGTTKIDSTQDFILEVV